MVNLTEIQISKKIMAISNFSYRRLHIAVRHHNTFRSENSFQVKNKHNQDGRMKTRITLIVLLRLSHTFYVVLCGIFGPKIKPNKIMCVCTPCNYIFSSNIPWTDSC